jgi:nitroimidazol reductase NimA-like FMN-containing flavoprotein (pyridoxamine 5'-phosphate oxidase superfamily)/ribosomal protein S18 acetylase RimI-like enzyme
MRKEIFRMDRPEAMALLARAPFVRVATTTASGAPMLRALNAAIVTFEGRRPDDRLVFHGAPVGEKTEALGREAVVSAEEVVASVPSYFVDPERACPATTLYRSVQVHGTLDPVDDPRDKVRALEALLEKHQPERGYVPLAHDHPLYRKTVASLLVVSVSLERLDGKSKLGQNRTPAEQCRMVEALWRRGAPTDAAAAFAVIAANSGMPAPDFLRAPDGMRLDAGAPSDAGACADLLAGEYWNDCFTREQTIRSHLASQAWIVARERDSGQVVASARGISDGAKYAWVYDVIVAPVHRGKRIGDALMRVLLDHPAMRRARLVRLGTRDAMHFYAGLGFTETAALPPRPYRSTEMVLVR